MINFNQTPQDKDHLDKVKKAIELSKKNIC